MYAFAYALHNLHNDLCVKGRAIDEQEMYRQAGVCREMVNFDGFEFYKNYLLNVSFIGKCKSFYLLRAQKKNDNIDRSLISIQNRKNLWRH